MANGIYGLGQKIERAGTQIKSFGQSAIDSISGITGRYTGAIGSTVLTGSFVGMDYNQVPNIRAAIREYVESIKTELAKLNTQAETSQAFKGQIEGAVKEYVQAINTAADAYVSHLLEYSDKMQEVYEKYMAHEENLSQQVKGQGTELSSSVDEYTEQK